MDNQDLANLIWYLSKCMPPILGGLWKQRLWLNHFRRKMQNQFGCVRMVVKPKCAVGEI